MEFQPFFPSCCTCDSFSAPQNFHPPSLPAMLLLHCLSVCTMYGGLSENPSHSKKRSRFGRQTSSSIVLSGALHPPPAPTAAGWGTPVHFSKVEACLCIILGARKGLQMDYQALYGWRISLPISLSLGPSSDFPGIEFHESTFGYSGVKKYLLEPTNFPISVLRVTPEVPGLYKVQIHSTLVEVQMRMRPEVRPGAAE